MKLKLKSKEKVAEKTKSFIFEKPGDLTWEPGQFLVMKLDLDREDKQGNKRWFTISSSPTENKVMITTRMRDGSVFKSYLDSLPMDSEIEIEEIGGEFILPKEQGKNLVFIAGGIGVTPARSITKYVADKNLEYNITILYSNRNVDFIAFKDEFKSLSKSHENLKVIHTLTKDVSDSWEGETGRIDEEMIKKYIEDLKNSIFYTSGHPHMVDAYRKLLPKMGIPEQNLVFENFGGYQVDYN